MPVLLAVNILSVDDTGSGNVDNSVLVPFWPRSVASLITDVLLLEIADGLILQFDDPRKCDSGYRDELVDRLTQRGIAIDIHDEARWLPAVAKMQRARP